MKSAYVIGSGPNGLTAAIVLAKAGVSVTLIEAQDTVGGGTRSAALTLPGFTHDICSAVHPMAVTSSALASFPLAEHGLEWIHSPAPVAHPLEDGSAVVLERSVETTAQRLGRDGRAYRRVVSSLALRWNDLADDILKPVHVPKHPFLLARFGMRALRSAVSEARTLFETREARALFAGMAGHSFLPLEQAGSSAIGWVLLLAGHAVGWPIPKGGSQRIADALASYFQSLGGRITLNTSVGSLDEVKDADAVLCDVTPRQLLRMAGNRLPDWFCRKLERYRLGPGVYKMDWALKAPIPWRNSDCARAATVHIGGTLEEIAVSERLACRQASAPHQGRIAEKPFILLAQPSLFDSTRAPVGQHTVWAYCHVPNGSTADVSVRIESQIERFAPGFREKILARRILTPADLEKHNANLIGGEITGGIQDLRQMFLRPTRLLYRTPAKGLYLCSASTPPGAGVHGLCGYYAAQAALHDAT